MDQSTINPLTLTTACNAFQRLSTLYALVNDSQHERSTQTLMNQWLATVLWAANEDNGLPLLYHDLYNSAIHEAHEYARLILRDRGDTAPSIINPCVDSINLRTSIASSLTWHYHQTALTITRYNWLYYAQSFSSSCKQILSDVTGLKPPNQRAKQAAAHGLVLSLEDDTSTMLAELIDPGFPGNDTRLSRSWTLPTLSQNPELADSDSEGDGYDWETSLLARRKRQDEYVIIFNEAVVEDLLQ